MEYFCTFTRVKLKKQYFYFYWSNILLYVSVLLLKYLICVLCPPLIAINHKLTHGNHAIKYFYRLTALILYIYIYTHTQWGKKVFSQPPIMQVLPLKKMREACNFHHRYTSTMRDKIREKNPENHIVGFFKNLFANYGGK